MNNDSEIAIRVSNINKDFILPTEQSNTVKGAFTNIFKVHKGGSEIQHALKEISFDIKEGEFFGIVGRNGSGKSTLLKILAGIYQPTNGKVYTKGRLVPFIELGVGFNGDLTGRENVYLNGALLGFSKNEIDNMYDDIVDFAELNKFMDQKLKNYSSGMQVRLAFSLAIRAEADILLVDEVLAVGDTDFQKKCFRYFRNLKKNNKTVVFVSHDMNAVQEYCDRAMLIEKSKLVLEGSSHEVASAYTRMFLEESKLESDINKTKHRWGNQSVVYEKADLSPQKLTKTDDKLTLTTSAVVMQDVPQAILGFKVRAEDDVLVLGSNTKIKKHELKNLKKGQIIELSWTFQNLFNTGKYYIDIAIQSSNYDDVYDWWEGSNYFIVERDEENSYPIHPPISLDVKLNKLND